MRKMTMALVILLTLGVAATASFAYDGWGCGGWGGRNDGPPALSDKDKAALDKFQADTRDLRRDLAAKSGEYQALLSSEKPDAARAGELSGQIYDLREQLGDKARAAGLPAFGPGNCGPGMGLCQGPGAGMGPGFMGGPGRGCRGRGWDGDGPGR